MTCLRISYLSCKLWGNKNKDALGSYLLKLKLLNKWKVLTEDAYTLYPLIGADLFPGRHSPLIGIDPKMQENISDKKNIRDLLLSIRQKFDCPPSGLKLRDFPHSLSVKEGTVNIPKNILVDHQQLEIDIREKAGKKGIKTLFIKGWIEFMKNAKTLKDATSEEYRIKAWEFIKMVSDNFIPKGGFVVLFENPYYNMDELSGKIMQELGYQNYLEAVLPQKYMTLLDRSFEMGRNKIFGPLRPRSRGYSNLFYANVKTSEAPVPDRNLLLDGRMMVFQKK
jgi:hypothetical protein